MEKIDFVITWLDDKDPVWQEKKAQYSPKTEKLLSDEEADISARYRDWDTLKYWFRSVEKNCPWVNKIFFVTEGHLPSWLNTNHEKLVIVKHEDYIPKEFLPTFNSSVIELNFHRIKGLAEEFVYFNDDVFVNSSLQKQDFFINGQPRDVGALNVINPHKEYFWKVRYNNVALINAHYRKKDLFKKHWRKFFRVSYLNHFLNTLLLYREQDFSGFFDPHVHLNLLKSDFDKMWQLEKEELTETSSHRFRDFRDLNPWLIRYIHIAEGNFYPSNPRSYRYYGLSDITMAKKVALDIEKSKHKVICLNDIPELEEFETIKEIVQQAFEKKYPTASSYELSTNS